MTRAVNITASSYSATENVALTLSGTGLSVGTGAGDLRLTIVTTDNLFTAGAGTTGVNIEFDPGYPDFGNYLDVYGTATQINNFLAGVEGAFLVFTLTWDDPTTSAVLELVVYDDESTDPFVRDYVESGRNNVSLDITPVNDCPVFTNSIPLNFPSRLNDPVPSGGVGTLVANLLLNAEDIDSTEIGMAITSLDTSNGAWYHSISGTWVLITAAPSASVSLLLPRTARLYFKPNTGFQGTIANAIIFRAWDQTTGTIGSTANTTTNGGSTAFSPTTDSADITMASVDVTLSILMQANNSGEGQYFNQIKGSYINVFSDTNFYSTYVAPLPNQRLLVSFFVFARGVEQCFGWYLVNSQAAADALAGIIEGSVNKNLLVDFLDIGKAIEFSSELMANSGYNSEYRIINLCADGSAFSQAGNPSATAGATAALSTGGVDAINGITVDFNTTGFNLYDVLCPVINNVLDTSLSALQLSNYNNPVGQPGFVITALDEFSFGLGTYQTALEAKVFAETVGTLLPTGIIGSSSQTIGTVRGSASVSPPICIITEPSPLTLSDPLTLNICLRSAVKTRSSSVKTKGFGDGYNVIVLSDIKPVTEAWALQTVPFRNAIAMSLENTLIGLGSDYINWTPPSDNTAKQYRISGRISRSQEKGDESSISFNLERIYRP